MEKHEIYRIVFLTAWRRIKKKKNLFKMFKFTCFSNNFETKIRHWKNEIQSVEQLKTVIWRRKCVLISEEIAVLRFVRCLAAVNWRKIRLFIPFIQEVNTRRYYTVYSRCCNHVACSFHVCVLTAVASLFVNIIVAQLP